MYKPIDELVKDDIDLRNIRCRTGHAKFDECCNGFNPGELILIAGKIGSAAGILMDNLAFKIAENSDVLLIKHDISEQNLRKQIAKNFDTTKSDNLLDKDISLHYEADVYFIEEIEKSVVEFTRKYNKPVLFISLLQSLFLSKEIIQLSREEEIKRIIFNLKRIAILYKIPIVVYSFIDSTIDDSATQAWLPDIECFGEAQRAFDKKIFTYWPSFHGKPTLTFPDEINVQIAGGGKYKHGIFDLELCFPKYKVYFE